MDHIEEWRMRKRMQDTIGAQRAAFYEQYARVMNENDRAYRKCQKRLFVTTILKFAGVLGAWLLIIISLA